MRIGAHVPTRGGLMGAIASARACGADAAQIWGSNPRAWAHPSVRPGAAESFGRAWRDAGLGPLFLHAPYMVNVASPDRTFRRRSVDLARATLSLAEAIGAEGVVVHAGSAGAHTETARGIALAAASLARASSGAEHARIFVELTAGGAGSVAATLPQARELFDALDPGARVALCLDTCHLFAAGYPLDSPEGVAETIRELRRLRLASKLRLMHANDSAFPRGERRDRHTNIGKGFIGRRGFSAILSQPALRRCAVVCETPGSLEVRARDVVLLRRLAGLSAHGSRSAPRSSWYE